MRRRSLNTAKSLFSQRMRNRLAPAFHLAEDGYASLRSLAGIGRSPDFLIIGAQKSGTTTLFSAIARHKDVNEPFRKEIGYFDRKFERFSPQWYFANFTAADVTMTGEATPDYLYCPEAPQRVKDIVPDARLLVILRDPISRAISHYHHEVRLGRETLDLHTALEREQRRLAPDYDATDDPASAMTPAQRRHYFSYSARGMYGEQVARWLAVFPVGQFHFIRFDDLKSDTARVTAAATEFLGLSPDQAAGAGPRENTGIYSDRTAAAPDGFRTQFAADQTRLRELVGFSVMAE